MNEFVTALIAPGGPFEVHEEVIDGIAMKAYANRFPNLTTVAQFGLAHADKEFIVYGARRITYGEFFAEVARLSGALHAAGIRSGDRVAVLSQNCPEWCAAFWATVTGGAILVGLNGWWTTDEILYGLEDSGSSILFIDQKRCERILDHLDDISAHTVVVVDGDLPDDAHEKLVSYREFAQGEPLPLGHTEIDEAQAAVIFYTSGTTGRPKGAISTHRSMIANLQNTVCMLTGNAMELKARNPAAPSSAAQPVSLFTAPLFHVAGCHSTLVVGVMGGLKLVMPEGKFDPVNALELIEAEKVTMWTAVPTMIWRTCQVPTRHDFDTSTVTSVGFGGSPSADELQRMVRETFPNIAVTTNAYGLTESSSVATVLTGAAAQERPTSVGLPMPVVDIAIDAGAGPVTTPGTVGEILIRGPILMKGYWNKPEATAAAIRDGWLYTGDIGHLDAEGFLYVTDRAKDMIIRGGENIYCVEIEHRLVEHPLILDAAVIGVAHPELGEEVKAVINVAADSTLTPSEVQAWVAETLAPFKVPAHVEIRTEPLPRNASGKLLKNLLRGSGDVSFAETM